MPSDSPRDAVTTNHLDIVAAQDSAHRHAMRLRLMVRDLGFKIEELRAWQGGYHATGAYERAIGALEHALAELRHATTQRLEGAQ